MRRYAGLLVLSLTAVPTFSNASEIAEGQRLAKAWCVSCHVVAPGSVGADAGPSFASVADRPGLSAGALRAWLTDPHPIMPRFDLSERQIQSLVAYIESLGSN
ncbi:MAG: c-type cytochrome [Pseudomonadota bacterium]